MSTISSFRSIESKRDVYRGKGCMKKFCESLREHAMKIIKIKKKNLTKELQIKMQKSVIAGKKNLKINIRKIIMIVKLGTIDLYRGISRCYS